MADTDPTPATPTGNPDDRNRDDWLLLAILLLADIDAAESRWKYDHDGDPLGLAGVPTGGDGWRWDDQRQIYVGRHGHKLSGDDLKNLSLLYAANVEHKLRESAADMAIGKTPIDHWQIETAQAVKTATITQAALAAGGFDVLKNSPGLWKTIEGGDDAPPGLKFSIGRLQNFAEDVAAGVARNDTVEAIEDRAALYGTSTNSVMEEVKRESHKGVVDDEGRPNFLYERNILGSENPCEPGEFTDGCRELTEAGWQSIGTMSPPGTRTCGPRCRCSLEFSLIGNALGSN